MTEDELATASERVAMALVAAASRGLTFMQVHRQVGTHRYADTKRVLDQLLLSGAAEHLGTGLGYRVGSRSYLPGFDA